MMTDREKLLEETLKPFAHIWKLYEQGDRVNPFSHFLDTLIGYDVERAFQAAARAYDEGRIPDPFEVEEAFGLNDPDAYYAEQERKHHEQLDLEEAEREEQQWFEENEEWDYDGEHQVCKNCNGTGQDADLTPCTECDGEGYYYWL